MDIKKEILWRVYICFLCVVALGFIVIGKAVSIQQVHGKYWRSLNDSLHRKIEKIEPERGTIYSEDGKMLSTSIPQFDVVIDFGAEGVRDKSGKNLFNNIDSLSIGLANIFNDKSVGEYKMMLQEAYQDKDRHFLLQKNVDFPQYKLLKQLPFIRQGKTKSGFIFITKTKRLNPFGMLAFRTIGLARDSNKVGIELSYDSVLNGKEGRRPVRYIAGGVAIPIEGAIEEAAENGKDIITTLDMSIQEAAESALQKMMEQNQAEYGTAIVMETSTGKIKALANLGSQRNGTYWEDKNYSMFATEPGSTFKLATMMALLEDKKINLSSTVNLDGGQWQFSSTAIVKDAEVHGHTNVTVQQAFELSSNVGMAKLVWANYHDNPMQFINNIHKMHLDSLTGIDLIGEKKSIIHKPDDKFWSHSTLPWMSFGYELQITPLQTAMLYNAVANNGKMMRPYLVSAFSEEGKIVEVKQPTVVADKICSDTTLIQLKQCLEGVCSNTWGTAHKLFKDSPYKVAGKTGTSLVADGNNGYVNQIYQSSFAGYFPANNPQYTIVIVVKNKMHALKYYGADVAGPVFKEIADYIYSSYLSKQATTKIIMQNNDASVPFNGNRKDAKIIMAKLNTNYKDSSFDYDEWINLNAGSSMSIKSQNKVSNKLMPPLNGLNLKDILQLSEERGLKVVVVGKGKTKNQSIQAFEPIKKREQIKIELN